MKSIPKAPPPLVPRRPPVVDRPVVPAVPPALHGSVIGTGPLVVPYATRGEPGTVDYPGMRAFRASRGIFYFAVLALVTVILILVGVVGFQSSRGSATVALGFGLLSGYLAWNSMRATVRVLRRESRHLEL